MSNIHKLTNKNTPEYIAEELAQEGKEIYMQVMDIMGEPEDLKGIFLFLLKNQTLAIDLIDVLEQAPSFDEFDRDTQLHFAMQVSTMLDNIITHAKKAKNNVGKLI